MKWEYTILYLDAIDSLDSTRAIVYAEIINRLGNEGWELVSVDSGMAYFKRLKQLTPSLPEFLGVTELIRTGYSADIE